MRRILLLAAVATSVALPSTAQAVCVGGDCFYTQGANVCWSATGSNGTVNTYCAGANGVEQCVTTHSGTQCYTIV